MAQLQIGLKNAIVYNTLKLYQIDRMGWRVNPLKFKAPLFYRHRSNHTLFGPGVTIF